MASRGGPDSRTPLPSTTDKQSKAEMRQLIAAASAALGTASGAGMSGDPAAPSEVLAAAPSAHGAGNGYMSINSLEHHAAVTRGHSEMQLAADLSQSPAPSTLPFPFFLTQSRTPPSSFSPAATEPLPATPASRMPLEMAADISSTARPSSVAPARVPSARKGSKRAVINPGIGSQPFTSERARAAAIKRWGAAAARRRGKGILSLSSLPSASMSEPPSVVGGLSKPAGSSLTGGSSTAGGPSTAADGFLMADRSARGGETDASAGLLALKSRPARTAGTASTAKTAVATRAPMAARATKTASVEDIGAKQAGGASKAMGAGKADVNRTSGGGSHALEIFELKKEVAALKREVADLQKLKVKLSNLEASVNMNAEQLSTHGHAVEVLGASFNDIKAQARKTCRPVQHASPGSDADGDDDEEEPPAPKRVRFAVDVAVDLAPTPPLTQGSQSNGGATPPPADGDVSLPPSDDGPVSTPPPAQAGGEVPSPAYNDYNMMPPPLPADDGLPPPPVSDEMPPQPPPAMEARGTNVAPRSRLRRPTARVCDVETRDEAQARRRAEGSIVMQCIRDLLNPRVTKMVALATVSRDVFLDPETKFEMIVENAMEYMGVGADEANIFLLEMIDQPTKKRVRGGIKPKAVRACAPLGMVFSHAMWGIKAVVVAAWFNAVHSSVISMTATTATQWKVGRRYGQSDGGRVGVIAASKQMFIHLNARHRIKEPTESGQVVAVHATTGHYGLICTFVAEALEAVATGVKNGGPDGDRFKRYVAEMVSLDEYLPKDNKEHNGLVLVDGADPKRAKFPEEYMPVTDDGADDLAVAAAVVA